MAAGDKDSGLLYQKAGATQAFVATLFAGLGKGYSWQGYS
jgi:hypothetical protein